MYSDLIQERLMFLGHLQLIIVFLNQALDSWYFRVDFIYISNNLLPLPVFLLIFQVYIFRLLITISHQLVKLLPILLQELECLIKLILLHLNILVQPRRLLHLIIHNQLQNHDLPRHINKLFSSLSFIFLFQIFDSLWSILFQRLDRFRFWNSLIFIAQLTKCFSFQQTFILLLENVYFRFHICCLIFWLVLLG